VAALEQRGWNSAGEPPIRDRGKSYGGCSLLFSRYDYLVTVQYAGAPDPPYGWDYAVSVSWERGQPIVDSRLRLAAELAHAAERAQRDRSFARDAVARAR